MRGYRRSLQFASIVALICAGASEARAQTLSLTVYAGAGTGGPIVYTTTGGSQSVTAVDTALNVSLAASGYGAYSFSSLSGSSNNPGDAGIGGYVLSSGDLHVNTGMTGGVGGNGGIGSPLTIALQESGFVLPAGGSGTSLVTAATANYAASALGSTQSDYSVFTDSTPTTITGSTLTQPSNGTPLDAHSNSIAQPLSPFVEPYTLQNVLTLSLTPKGSASSDGFSGQTMISTAPVPEPATLATMLLGLAAMTPFTRRRRVTAL